MFWYNKKRKEVTKMSLIKCPECKKEISDQATSCPHCGFPLQKKERLKNNRYSIKLVDAGSSKAKIIVVIRNVTGLSLTDAKFIADNNMYIILDIPLEKAEDIKKSFEEKSEDVKIEIQPYEEWQRTYRPVKTNGSHSNNSSHLQQISQTPLCPYCSSANTKKISGTSRVGSALMFGLFSKKIGKQWHCNSCGSDF